MTNTIAFANDRFPSPHIANFEPKSVKDLERALVLWRRHVKGTLSMEKPKLEKLKLLPRQLFPCKILPRQLFARTTGKLVIARPATQKLEIPRISPMDLDVLRSALRRDLSRLKNLMQ
ncbi:hypothetical protein AnigIFM60653_001722 [Aspergillus niger]|nr:hypothetical protein AnigIFM60653_001722 [Aspergillus niger]